MRHDDIDMVLYAHLLKSNMTESEYVHNIDSKLVNFGLNRQHVRAVFSNENENAQGGRLEIYYQIGAQVQVLLLSRIFFAYSFCLKFVMTTDYLITHIQSTSYK